MSGLPLLESWPRTFEDVGHRVLGIFGQDRAEAGNKLWRTKVDEQLPQTIAGETAVWNKNRTQVQKKDVDLKPKKPDCCPGGLRHAVDFLPLPALTVLHQPGEVRQVCAETHHTLMTIQSKQ